MKFYSLNLLLWICLLLKIPVYGQDTQCERMARGKVEMLATHIVTITNKDACAIDIEDSVEEVKKMFESGSKIEVRNGGGEVNAYPVGQYLKNLQALPYAWMDMKWKDIQLVSGCIHGSYGSDYATVTLVVSFVGYNENNQIMYNDPHTEKRITVILKPVKRKRGGVNKGIYWDFEVKLKDMLVLD